MGQPGLAAQVGYSLAVQLKEGVPPGYIQDQLVLVTNDQDARSARVPVSVEGLVVAGLSVRPSPLLMVATEVDQPVTRNLVVQGRAPFHITAIRSSDDRLQCKLSSDARPVQVVPVTFLAKQGSESSGSVKAKIRIETDLPGASAVEVDVSVQTKPAAATKP